MPYKHHPDAETETFEREVLIPQATPKKRRTTLTSNNCPPEGKTVKP
ncbi:MAG: hypothetical protein ACRERD_05750 [Candidatus Binatia bacterium]